MTNEDAETRATEMMRTLLRRHRACPM